MTEVQILVLGALIKCVVALVALLTIFAYMTLIERRVLARFQRRIGPNRAGPLGLLQPLADGLKMIFKEQIIPSNAHRLVFLAAPCISVFVALSAFAVIPLGAAGTFGSSIWGQALAPYIADVNVGVLYILAISSLAVYGIVLGGWSSGNHYSLLGALRSAAQMVSYEVSIALSLAGVFMFSQTLSMTGIVEAQVNYGVWFIVVQPLGFVLYSIAAIAEVNRAPFDLPEAEQELVAGYLTEFSGLRWSLYQMAEYINMIIVSSIAATLYFGGWTLGGLSGIAGIPVVWYVFKVAAFLFIFMWMRATLPRIRYDQLMRLGWQVLLPLSVLNLLATGTVIALGWPWWTSAAIGLLVLLVVATLSYVRLRRTVPSSHRTKAHGGLQLPDSVHLVRVGAPAADANLDSSGSGGKGTALTAGQ